MKIDLDPCQLTLNSTSILLHIINILLNAQDMQIPNSQYDIRSYMRCHICFPKRTE